MAQAPENNVLRAIGHHGDPLLTPEIEIEISRAKGKHPQVFQGWFCWLLEQMSLNPAKQICFRWLKISLKSGVFEVLQIRELRRSWYLRFSLASPFLPGFLLRKDGHSTTRQGVNAVPGISPSSGSGKLQRHSA